MKLTVRTLALLCALLLPHAYAAPGNDGESAGKSADVPHASAAGEGAVGDMILQAVSLMGIAYRFGGNTPVNGFDCSGFIRYVFQSSGVNLPRSAAEQAQVGRPVSRDELKPGDVLFFNTRGFNYSHNGLYLGNGRFIHAPRTGKNIEITSLNASYWSSRFNGARRMVKGAGGVVAHEVTDDVKRAESLGRKREREETSTLADAGAAAGVAGVGAVAAAAAASPRVHATLLSKDAEVKIPTLSAACKQARNAKTAKCKTEKQAIAKAEKSAKAAGKGKYTLSKGESGKNIKGKQGRDKAEAKSSAKGNSKYRAAASSKDKGKGKAAAVKPTNKKKR